MPNSNFYGVRKMASAARWLEREIRKGRRWEPLAAKMGLAPTGHYLTEADAKFAGDGFKNIAFCFLRNEARSGAGKKYVDVSIAESQAIAVFNRAVGWEQLPPGLVRDVDA